MINCPADHRDDKCFRNSEEGAISPSQAEETVTRRVIVSFQRDLRGGCVRMFLSHSWSRERTIFLKKSDAEISTCCVSPPPLTLGNQLVPGKEEPVKLNVYFPSSCFSFLEMSHSSDIPPVKVGLEFYVCTMEIEAGNTGFAPSKQLGHLSLSKRAPCNITKTHPF